jgi:hypothetical protein
MLEGAVAAVLQKALGAYLEGIDSTSLRASVWDGDIVLRNLSLKTSALEALQLPVRVLGGSVGVVRVQVPWRKLRTEPIVINIEGLWLLLAPQDSTEQWDEEGERTRALAAMKQRLEVWEEVEAKKGADALGAGMLEQLTTALLRRLRIQVLGARVGLGLGYTALLSCFAHSHRPSRPHSCSKRAEEALVPSTKWPSNPNQVTNVHVRLESSQGDIAAGVVVRSLTLNDLAAADSPAAAPGVTLPTSMVHKAIELTGAAVYLSSAAFPETRGGARAAAAPPLAATVDGEPGAAWAARMLPMLRDGPSSCHVLRPLSAVLLASYDAGGKPSDLWPQAAVNLRMLAPLQLALHREQMVVLLGLAEVTARSERRHRLRSCRRPQPPAAQSPAEWWAYARRCVSHQRRTGSVRLNWAELKGRCAHNPCPSSSHRDRDRKPNTRTHAHAHCHARSILLAQ